MTDTPGGTPPFPGFPGIPGFSQADMMGKMWELMRLNPFAAAAMPGGTQGVGPSLSMMSDMLAPLTNIEELDKRVTDMRAVSNGSSSTSTCCNRQFRRSKCNARRSPRCAHSGLMRRPRWRTRRRRSKIEGAGRETQGGGLADEHRVREERSAEGSAPAGA